MWVDLRVPVKMATEAMGTNVSKVKLKIDRKENLTCFPPITLKFVVLILEAPGRCGNDISSPFFKPILRFDILSTSCEIGLS